MILTEAMEYACRQISSWYEWEGDRWKLVHYVIYRAALYRDDWRYWRTLGIPHVPEDLQ